MVVVEGECPPRGIAHHVYDHVAWRHRALPRHQLGRMPSHHRRLLATVELLAEAVPRWGAHAHAQVHAALCRLAQHLRQLVARLVVAQIDEVRHGVSRCPWISIDCMVSRIRAVDEFSFIHFPYFPQRRPPHAEAPTKRGRTYIHAGLARREEPHFLRAFLAGAPPRTISAAVGVSPTPTSSSPRAAAEATRRLAT